MIEGCGLMPSDRERLIFKQVEWAHEYNGYARLARTPENLARILEPAWQEYRRTNRIPEWCGVDLLRGWAFYLTRADRHGGGYGLMEGGSMIDEWEHVIEALALHEEASRDDLPPMDPHSRGRNP